MSCHGVLSLHGQDDEGYIQNHGKGVRGGGMVGVKNPQNSMTSFIEDPHRIGVLKGSMVNVVFGM